MRRMMATHWGPTLLGVLRFCHREFEEFVYQHFGQFCVTGYQKYNLETTLAADIVTDDVTWQCICHVGI